MFDLVRNNKRVVQWFLFLITVPFAFFGVESYLQSSGDNSIGTVGKHALTNQQFGDALKQQQDLLRRQFGSVLPQEVLNGPEIRKAALDALINQALLSSFQSDRQFLVPDAAVQKAISVRDEFRENGEFSFRLYELVLKQSNVSQNEFERRMRDFMAQQAIFVPLAQSALAPRSASRRLLEVQDEVRNVNELNFSVEEQIGKVRLEEEQVASYYKQHNDRFILPEQVKVEYIVFEPDALLGAVSISDQEALSWYHEHLDSFKKEEERRASHILIQINSDATESDRSELKKKAERLRSELIARPGSFSSLAKKFSQDEVSARQGGDLGFLRRGATVKAFEDALWGLKPGELSGVVETQYGLHVIKLVDIRGGGVETFDAVKGQVVQQLRQQGANRLFTEQLESFTNAVYERGDDLPSIASSFGLKVQQSGWISRSGSAPQPFDNEKLRAAIFTQEAIEGRNASEAIDVGRGYISSRVIEHKPAASRPLAEVAESIRTQLLREEAHRLAVAAGMASLSKLTSDSFDGEPLKWSVLGALKRGEGALAPEAIKKIFSVAVDRLPVFVGVERPGDGYSVFKIDRVETPKVVESDPRIGSLANQLQKLTAQEDARAFLAGVRARTKVELNERFSGNLQGGGGTGFE